MSSESESSFCSTCSESHFESSLSDISLNDEDIDYTNHFTDDSKRHLFYLKIIDVQNKDKTSVECQTPKTDNRPTDGSEPVLNTSDRFRSSYTRITSGLNSWVFHNKPKIKNKSFKRKSSKKKDKNETICENKPSISVSFCEDIDNNSIETKTSNKLFDLIEGNSQTIGSKIDNKFVLMYLMPPNDTQTDCLLFSYPKQDTEDSNPILLRLKGMFVTLSQVVSQITNQSIIMSSIAVNDQNNEQIYKIGFVHELDSLLVLALPNQDFTDIEVEAIVQTIARVIKFTYNSMDSAFKDQSNHESLNKMFSSLEYLLTEDMKYSTIDSIFINTIKRLLIDDNLAINLSDSLSEYEAMDWLSEDSSLDIHQQNGSEYIVIGSCLLYKGFLLSSHLSNSRLKDIYCLLSVKGLLALHKSHSIRLVLWSEVFPMSEHNNESNDEYNESEENKYFVSIVGYIHMIHCTLIEMSFISAEEIPIKANEVIINESIRLLKSHFTKSGIIEEIDHCFDVQLMAVNNIFDQKTEQKRYKSLSSLKDLLSLASSSSQTKSQNYHSTGSLSSLDDSSVSASLKSYSSPSLQHSFISRTSSSATSLSHSNSKDMSSLTCSPNNCIYLKQNFKLPENMICYLDIEDGQQIFAGPLLQWPKDICEQIFKKFAKSCYEMSRQFSRSTDLCSEIGRTFEIRIVSNLLRFLSPNKLKSKKSENEIHLFYTIGRHDRNIEFYVCFKANGSDLVTNDFEIEDFMYKIRLQRRLS